MFMAAAPRSRASNVKAVKRAGEKSSRSGTRPILVGAATPAALQHNAPKSAPALRSSSTKSPALSLVFEITGFFAAPHR